MDKYRFRKYNKQYYDFFTKELEKIKNALGDKPKVEHVGSTAIPNLGGKGIIDILIGVSIGSLDKAKEKLIRAGYEFRETASTADRLFFRIDYPYKNDVRRVHIHLTSFKGNDWNQLINFRNYLLKDPVAVDKYIKIKQEGAKKAQGEGAIYREYKRKFIEDILKLSVKRSP